MSPAVAIMVGTAECKSLELPLPAQMKNIYIKRNETVLFF